jgi:hypothetical protein
MVRALVTLVLCLGCLSPFLMLGWALERQQRLGCRCLSSRRFQRVLCAFLLDHGRTPYR